VNFGQKFARFVREATTPGARRARLAAGTPQGGQFTANYHEPMDNLRMPVEKGSFVYPPHFRSVEEYVGFWTTVDVPDDVIDVVTARLGGPDNIISEEARMLARCEMMLRHEDILTEEDKRRMRAYPVPFPSKVGEPDRVFTPYDALEWWDVQNEPSFIGWGPSEMVPDWLDH
jgi:hypothetical protein